MARNITVQLEFVVLLCLTLVHCGDCYLPGNVYQDKRSDWRWKFSTVSPSGIQQCVRMCFLNGLCKSVTFDRSQLACHLNNRDSDPGSLITDRGHVFINNITGTQDLVRNCKQSSCGEKESCITVKSGFACISRTICGHRLYSHDNETNTCYRFVNSPLLNWTAAEGYCQGDGAHLISLRTVEQTNLTLDQIMNPTVNTLGRYWIGLNDIEEQGLFRWTDGTQLEFSNWNTQRGQPDNNDGTETPADCVVVRWDGKWADDSCKKEYGFICEIDL